ncbi:MAG: hypothetical protein VR69_09325 [Peptococcaceae bacterium BRH_c4b]|nr:MAG: hypothetical protein VR69_09325 [Peptococcaceae bacterium BRH_c4b]
MQPKIDVRFALIGNQIPVDHGYLLFSAISKIFPFIHTNRQVAIHPINGPCSGNRLMDINRKSYLTLRVPTSMVPEIIQLSGSLINIGDYEVRVGVPSTQPFIPTARLYSRLVVIKGSIEPESFIEVVHKQMCDLNVKGKPMLIWQPEIVMENEGKPSGTHSSFLRRTLRIKDKNIVGYALKIENLTAEESIRIQENGIGGRQRFGCGVFVPVR